MAALNGLPERFENLISALDALLNEERTLSLDLVKSRLIQEEQRMLLRSETHMVKTEAAALVAKNKPSS